MKTFKQIMSEASSMSTYKIGKIKVELKKNGSKVDAFIDGTKLDTFADEKEAKSAVKDYMELINK